MLWNACLFSFLLPPQSVDRSAFKMTLILGYTVFLLLMNDLLPVTGDTIPLINVFFSLCLALMVASLLETILITNLHSSSRRLAPVPRWVRVVFLQTLGCCVGLPSKPPKEHSTDPNDAVEEGGVYMNPPGGKHLVDTTLDALRTLGRDLQAIRRQVDRQQRGNHNSEEWTQVAGVIDRFLFWLYAVFIIVSFVVMICIWASSCRLNFHCDNDFDRLMTCAFNPPPDDPSCAEYTLNTRVEVKPKAPILTSVTREKGNYLVAWDTKYNDPSFELTVWLNYRKEGENGTEVDVSFMESYEILGKSLEPRTEYLVSVQSNSADPFSGRTTLDALRTLGRDVQAIRRQVDRQQRGNHNSEEWTQVAGVIDRFLFWLYAVFIIVSFVVMICIWASSYSK
ncbi:uncharacterized protein LOC132469523 [Gadus macrocephalus]|uniref:uncharacterized protein LOC132469523 n=1 Tax=Gadus macrocephalus TaxID=80720 RepID=UPI0028CB99E4|nr:uncharacterized protein LOC132469523 [Gadus macrocephalus]